MARPKKPTAEKILEGTYRQDRDSEIKIGKNKNTDKYETIKLKLQDVENIIKETPVKNNAKILVDYCNLYQKLIHILEAPSLENDGVKKEETVIDQLINKKQS
jgi:hypothetical protein